MIGWGKRDVAKLTDLGGLVVVSCLDAYMVAMMCLTFVPRVYSQKPQNHHIDSEQADSAIAYMFWQCRHITRETYRPSSRQSYTNYYLSLIDKRVVDPIV